ncbi:unnamed protein product [Phyllotreta striolata]|uniref:Lipase domain-containing protein n=1 Tax=Phyllotreta striolata TaxID=444603 RepID=A0A9N9TZ84_PHYSR|nr:unnamed protein product [Phyllotreta striolata]
MKVTHSLKRILFVCAVNLVCFSCVASNKHDGHKFKKEQAKLGVDFVYFPDMKGQTRRVSLKYDNHTQVKLEEFYNNEKLFADHKKIGRLRSAALKDMNDAFNFSNEVHFILYTRELNDSIGTGVNLTTFDFKEYNITRDTKIIFHGYMENGSSDFDLVITNSYLKVSDVNIIVVDWSYLSGTYLYTKAVMSLGEVADYCAKFVAYLIRVVGVKQNQLHFIGFSLGAHLAGFTGKRLRAIYSETIQRISGLDPAAPLFEEVNLNQQDANFVDIIHTDGHILGLYKATGHVDFYPNGGVSPQPDCYNINPVEIDICSHTNSWKLYSETIINEHLYTANCSDDKQYPMGKGTPIEARGNCILSTDTDQAMIWFKNLKQEFSLLHFSNKLVSKIFNFFDIKIFNDTVN